MAQGEVGKKTRARILLAACELFGKKGFRDTTVAEICSHAGVNIASVNYYFGGKESLYVESWKLAHSKADESLPGREVLRFSGPPEERLRIFVLHLLNLFGDDGKLADLHRFQVMELLNPTGLLDEEFRKVREPMMSYVLEAIRELLGDCASTDQVLLCEMTVMSQCQSIFPHGRRFWGYYQGKEVTKELIEEVADHITRFSIGGIRTIRESCAGAGRAIVDESKTGIGDYPATCKPAHSTDGGNHDL